MEVYNSSILTQPQEEQDGVGWQALTPTGHGNPWEIASGVPSADPVWQEGLLMHPDPSIRMWKKCVAGRHLRALAYIATYVYHHLRVSSAELSTLARTCGETARNCHCCN